MNTFGIRILRNLVLRLLIGFAKATDRWRNGAIPVFVFHSVDNSGSPISVSPERFDYILGYLLSKRFRLLSAGRAIQELKLGPSKDRRAVLTFDDAYVSIYPWVKTILDQGQNVTIFVPTKFIGQSNQWDEARKDIDQFSILSSETILELHHHGCEIASHTMTHANLQETDSDTTTIELKKSRECLESILRESVTLMAYPYGAHNEKVMELVEDSGYRAAFSTAEGYMENTDNLFSLPRFSANIDILIFRLIIHRGFHWYMWIQRCSSRLISKSHSG